MKVEILSRKLIKPSIPTPTSLRNYSISFTDDLAPTMNVPLILYYPCPAATLQAKDCTSLDNILLSKSYHFEKTLAQTLTKFYPLAGRYMNHNRSIDCSDQGAEYVRAKVVGVQLNDILGHGAKPEALNDFVPCEVGAVDEPSDPLLSIQVTMFDCGGMALGFCFSHRLVDMGTISTFIDNWAAASKRSENHMSNLLEISPLFNAAILFPAKDSVPRLDLRLPRTRTGVENEARMFLFNKDAISVLRGKAGVKDPLTQTRPYSKVQLVFALLYKAMLGVERAKNGGCSSKASTLFMPTNLRDKVVPPLPKESFGNFWGLATARLKAGEGDSIEFKSCLDLIRDSIRKTVSDCKEILTRGEEGYGVIINQFLEMKETMIAYSIYNEVNCYMFTCWSKFSFYQADFGWGKPIWASTVKHPLQNAAILMDDKDGDGIEAWVHLHKNDMTHFLQDPDILAFAT